jgi:hypothetical protein
MSSELKINKNNTLGIKSILIEQDAGYIDPREARNSQFVNEIKKLDSGQRIIAEPLILYVVLQKWGVQNRNGRIYPKEILERENNKYQQLIKERRAIGR